MSKIAYAANMQFGYTKYGYRRWKELGIFDTAREALEYGNKVRKRIGKNYTLSIEPIRVPDDNDILQEREKAHKRMHRRRGMTKFPLYYCFYSGSTHESKTLWNMDEVAQAAKWIKQLGEGFITANAMSEMYWVND